MSSLVFFHFISNQLVLSGTVSRMSLCLLEQLHLGMLTLQHYNKNVFLGIWLHGYCPYFVKSLAFYPVFGVSLATAAWKYIFRFYLRVSHTKWCESPDMIVYWIVMKNKSSELTRLDWVGIRLNQFVMFEERFKLLLRWKQFGFEFETKGCLKTMNK